LFPGTYHAAVIENRSDFTGRVVVDVGAGSGILSLFAAQVSSSYYLGLSRFVACDKCLQNIMKFQYVSVPPTIRALSSSCHSNIHF